MVVSPKSIVTDKTDDYYEYCNLIIDHYSIVLMNFN